MPGFWKVEISSSASWQRLLLPSHKWQSPQASLCTCCLSPVSHFPTLASLKARRRSAHKRFLPSWTQAPTSHLAKSPLCLTFQWLHVPIVYLSAPAWSSSCAVHSFHRFHSHPGLPPLLLGHVHVSRPFHLQKPNLPISPSATALIQVSVTFLFQVLTHSPAWFDSIQSFPGQWLWNGPSLSPSSLSILGPGNLIFIQSFSIQPCPNPFTVVSLYSWTPTWKDPSSTCLNKDTSSIQSSLMSTPSVCSLERVEWKPPKDLAPQNLWTGTYLEIRSFQYRWHQLRGSVKTSWNSWALCPSTCEDTWCQ